LNATAQAAVPPRLIVPVEPPALAKVPAATVTWSVARKPVPVRTIVTGAAQVVAVVRVTVPKVTTVEAAPTVPVVVVPLVIAVQPTAVKAFAGAIAVNVPIASEATAIADTFFNEIVFTIFLSFSRFQAFPGLGWWLKRPPH
jgi:hypothetical protein